MQSFHKKEAQYGHTVSDFFFAEIFRRFYGICNHQRIRNDIVNNSLFITAQLQHGVTHQIDSFGCVAQFIVELGPSVISPAHDHSVTGNLFYLISVLHTSK